MGKYTPYILFGAIALIVLYALSRIKSPAAVQVPEFIATGSTPQSDASAQRDPARVSVFDALASLGASQSANELARFQTEASLEASKLDYQLQSRSLDVSSDLERYKAEVARELGLKEFDTQTDLYDADVRSRMAQYEQMIKAFQQTATQFQKNDLKRQGTAFNALASLFGNEMPYEYTAVYGPKTTPWWQSAINSFAGGAGTYLTGGFNQIGQLFRGGAQMPNAYPQNYPQSGGYWPFGTPPFNPNAGWR